MRKLPVLVMLFVIFTFGAVNSSKNMAYAYIDITSPSKGQQIPLGTRSDIWSSLWYKKLRVVYNLVELAMSF